MHPQHPLVIYVSKMETTTGIYYYIRSDAKKPWKYFCDAYIKEKDEPVKNERLKISKKDKKINGEIKKEEKTIEEKRVVADIIRGITDELLLNQEKSPQKLIFEFNEKSWTECMIKYGDNESLEVTEVMFFQPLSFEEMRYFFIAQRDMQEETLKRHANVRRIPIILE
jgi:hypothetical protein